MPGSSTETEVQTPIIGLSFPNQKDKTILFVLEQCAGQANYASFHVPLEGAMNVGLIKLHVLLYDDKTETVQVC